MYDDEVDDDDDNVSGDAYGLYDNCSGISNAVLFGGGLI